MRGRWKALVAAVVITAPRCSTAPPCSNHSAPHASFSLADGCAGYYCAMSCEEGFADCDGDQSNGCETSTTSGLPPNTEFDPGFAASSGGCGETPTAVETIGNCAIECKPGFFDCDGNKTNGCETASFIGCPASRPDASFEAGTSVQRIATLTARPHGLVACAGLDFFLNGTEVRAVDPKTLTLSFIATSPTVPLDGLACDGAMLFWSTPSTVDGGAPNGALWAVPIAGGTPGAVATGFDAASGVDVRGDGIFAMSSAGLLFATADAGLSPWMTATPTDAYKAFALGANDEWSIAGSSIVHRDDAGASTWLDDAGAPAAVVLAGGRPVASLHADSGDAGPASDWLARLDDDAGSPALTPFFTTTAPIVATASGTKAIFASDETIYVVDSGQAFPLYTTTDHVVDVAIDGSSVVWTTRGTTTSSAGVFRGAIP